LTWNAFLLKNLIPVTLGNIIGGGFFVGILYLWAYRKTLK
jgi:formate transporter